MSKYLNEDGVLYLWQKLKALFAGKVDKVEGKGLSTNDFTTEEKNKLAGIAAGADVSEQYSNFTGATSSAAGTSGLVPAPTSMNWTDLLRGDGRWCTLSLSLDSGTNQLRLATVDRNGSITSVHGLVTLPNATQSLSGLMSTADKTKLDAFGAASDYALKSDITSMYKHKGSVSAVTNLPASGNTAGDVYNVTATGMNYVWVEDNGSGSWDALGEVFTIDNITNSEIDTILAT